MSRYVTKELVELFVKTWNKRSDHEVSVETLNCGWCYQFAVLLKRLYGDKVSLYHDNSHAWVKIGSKYYDSDHRSGVSQLGLISHFGFIYENISERQLIDHWRHGNTGRVNGRIINEVIRLYRR
jgi:hypothetical protein